MALSDDKDEVKCYYLFIPWAWTQIMMAQIASILRVSTILKRRDAMLTQVKVSITCKAKIVKESSCVQLDSAATNRIALESRGEIDPSIT